MKPAWLKKKMNLAAMTTMQARLRGSKLHSVCEEARCPNISECFSKGVATVMIMGDICTRNCKFCAVATGRPKALDIQEPVHVAEWVKNQQLKHVVITSVDRDDLPDLGAGHFARTISQVKKVNPHVVIEVLTPDFQGVGEFIDKVCLENPKIFNHNLETVERLTPQVRSAAKYRRSLGVIAWIKKQHPHLMTKSGLMLGLGETHQEILHTMEDLLNCGCNLLTLGQYLQPTKQHLDVVEYISPKRFEDYKKIGLDKGFQAVFSGAFVRSSYMAEDVFRSAVI
jgi:lipoic acid synthetase